MKFNWQQTVIILVASFGLIGFIVRSLLTGEDIPVNYQIILGGIFGLALGSAGISTLFKRDDKEKTDQGKGEDAK